MVPKLTFFPYTGDIYVCIFLDLKGYFHAIWSAKEGLRQSTTPSYFQFPELLKTKIIS